MDITEYAWRMIKSNLFTSLQEVSNAEVTKRIAK